MGANEPASTPVVKGKSLKTKTATTSKPASRPSAKTPVFKSPSRPAPSAGSDLLAGLFSHHAADNNVKKQPTRKQTIPAKQAASFSLPEVQPDNAITTKAARTKSKDWRINKPTISQHQNPLLQPKKRRNPDRERPVSTDFTAGTLAAASAARTAGSVGKAGKVAGSLAASSMSGVTAGTLAASGAGLALGYTPWNKQREIEDLGDGRRGFGAPGDLWKREQVFDITQNKWLETGSFIDPITHENKTAEQMTNPDRGFTQPPRDTPHPGF